MTAATADKSAPHPSWCQDVDHVEGDHNRLLGHVPATAAGEPMFLDTGGAVFPSMALMLGQDPSWDRPGLTIDASQPQQQPNGPERLVTVCLDLTTAEVEQLRDLLTEALALLVGDGS